MICLLYTNGGVEFLNPTIERPTPSDVGVLLGMKNGWALITMSVIMIQDQIFQLYYIAGNTAPKNHLITRVLGAIGELDQVHGTAVILTREHMIPEEQLSEFHRQMGHA